MPMKLAVPLLYWLGLLIVLAGLFLRFWMGQPEMARWGLAMALVGMALVLGSLGPGDDPSPRQASEGASRNHMNASMKAYNGVPVPEGELIQAGDGKFLVPDHPIIPFIEGDGTAPDIW